MTSHQPTDDGRCSGDCYSSFEEGYPCRRHGRPAPGWDPKPTPPPSAVNTPEHPAPSSPAPELLAVIRSSKKTLVVVKRGGDPVHVSEVIPDVLENILTQEDSAA